MILRIKEKYVKEVIPLFQKEYQVRNPMGVPKLRKIVINSGVGRATENAKLLEQAKAEITAISGQAPVVTKSKVAIASFKLKKGESIGVKVTLRRSRMYEFFDRLVNIALPRVRDFKGVSPKGFDGRGNYTLGIKEQLIFPEIIYDKVDKVMGMNITIETSADNDADGFRLLKALGFPFRES